MTPPKTEPAQLERSTSTTTQRGLAVTVEQAKQSPSATYWVRRKRAASH